jgi:hypothetical protein
MWEVGKVGYPSFPKRGGKSVASQKHELQPIVQTPAEVSHSLFHKRTKLQRSIFVALCLESVESVVHILLVHNIVIGQVEPRLVVCEDFSDNLRL